MRRWIALATMVFALNPGVRAQPVYFADPDLKARVEAKLGVANPTAADMLGLNSLYAPWKDISDLTGLDYATNLESLVLEHNQVSDLSPLAGLTNLEQIYLLGNQVSDLSPLAGLTNLERLYLWGNQISDLSPLAGLTNLEWLDLTDNQISDISPLAGLTNLRRLDLTGNRIRDISPLAGLTNLLYLGLSGNPLCQEACDIRIPQMRANGTEVNYAGCALLPDVVGMTESEAEGALTAAGFVIGRKAWGPSDAPKGTIIGQDPAGGETRQREIEVDLTLSQGFGNGGGEGPGPGAGTSLPVAVAHWRLDESSGTMAHDETGNHHGTVYGGPIWQPAGGMFAGALLFDGIDDYVDCGTFNPSAATGKLTVCLWAKWNGLSGWFQGLMGKRDSHTPQAMMWQIEASIDSGELSFSRAWDVGVVGAALPIGEWSHVGATFDGAIATFYLDGHSAASAPFSQGSGTAGQVVFGACEKNGGNPFNGALDDVWLYDEALSESHIKAVMMGAQTLDPNQGIPLPVAVAHWRLDESAGRTASDSSGADHDATVHGNPIWQPAGGKLAGALLFDGADDYVDCGTFNPSEATGQLTVCLWAKWNGPNGQYQGLIGKRDAFSAQGMMWQIEASMQTGNLTFKQAADPGIATATLPIGEWAHVGVTFDGALATFYLGGNRGMSRSFPLGSGTAAQVVFGACGRNGINPFHGALDDVRLYNEALSDDQMKAVMAGAVAEPTNGGPEPGGLLAHWAFDETAGRVAAESVGGIDGITMGGPVWQPGGGKVGGALKFDGANDCVLTDFVLNPADGPFSVFAWIKGGAPGEVIVSQDGSQGGADWLMAAPSSGRLMADLKAPGPAGRSLSSAKVVTDGNWHEVGLTWDGTNRTLYVNGVTVAADTQAELAGSAGGLNIGTGKDLDPGTYWSGMIDEVRIYNQAVQP